MSSILFKGGHVFTGEDNAGEVMDVFVEDQRISQIGKNLDVNATEVIDCQGKWVTPGLLDIHTHLDLEVELAPGLGEVVRHGSTTVVMSNCSLGVAYGNQRQDGADPITDCFARVENIPKNVLRKVGDAVTWQDSGDYLDHFDQLNLGPNVVSMIPHSMLRIEVMGLEDSLSRDPTEAELKQMEALIEKGMQEGYAGFSTDALPFHYLANQPNTRKQIPTQFANYGELKRLTNVVRNWGRVWQATPPKDNPAEVARNFLLSSGRLHGKPLKVTATAAMDFTVSRKVAILGKVLSRIINSRLFKGIFRFQALSAPFKTWADGAVTPIAEEVPELRLLNECDLEDSAARLKILNDPEYIKAFRKMWFHGKSGFNLANLKRKLRMEDNFFTRRLDEMTVHLCPLANWSEEPLQAPYERLLQFQNDGTGAANEEEKAFFESLPPIHDDCDFFMQLLREWDTVLRWHVTTANTKPAKTKELLFDPLNFPGFNDSGAHLTNMAFYDGNLRTLQFAKEDGLATVGNAIHRLTKAPADFFGLNAGHLTVGAQADICVFDPAALDGWAPESTVEYVWRDLFDSHQMVNRPPAIVSQVFIGGQLAWDGENFGPDYEQKPMGRYLRHKDHPREQEWAATAA